MPRKVAEEMPAAERCDRLIHGLEASGSDEVALCFSHLAHAMGSVKEAEKFVDGMTEVQGLMPSAFKKGQKMVRQGTCNVNRVDVLEALLKKKEQYAKAAIDKNINK